MKLSFCLMSFIVNLVMALKLNMKWRLVNDINTRSYI